MRHGLNLFNLQVEEITEEETPKKKICVTKDGEFGLLLATNDDEKIAKLQIIDNEGNFFTKDFPFDDVREIQTQRIPLSFSQAVKDETEKLLRVLSDAEGRARIPKQALPFVDASGENLYSRAYSLWKVQRNHDGEIVDITKDFIKNNAKTSPDIPEDAQAFLIRHKNGGRNTWYTMGLTVRSLPLAS